MKTPYNKSILFCVVLVSMLASVSGMAKTPSGRSLTIVLDAGHTAAAPGAVGIRAVPEVAYNDSFVKELSMALRGAGHKVTLTRTPSQDVTLNERADLANRGNYDLFLSIHHDSAQPQYLEETKYKGQAAWKAKVPIRGYSLFVSKLNPKYSESLAVAKLISREIYALGRAPTLHHAENISGENRQLLDKKLGVYRFDVLVVLRKTRVPALLLEVGLIVDANDEAYVRDAGNRKAMIDAILVGLARWQR
jgi:N-acetylmuramoyl-L-alanine amidase